MMKHLWYIQSKNETINEKLRKGGWLNLKELLYYKERDERNKVEASNLEVIIGREKKKN